MKDQDSVCVNLEGAESGVLCSTDFSNVLTQDDPESAVDKLLSKLSKVYGKDHIIIQVLEKRRAGAALTVEEVAVAVTEASLKDPKEIAKLDKDVMKKLINSVELGGQVNAVAENFSWEQTLL
jgi:hypothetical protein